MLDSRRLQYFIVLAEELHFGRAAERVHISQPGLSDQIKALETELGVRLLERTSRRVKLTPAGEVLYKEGKFALADLAQAETRAQRAGQGVAGRLTIGVIPSAIYVVLPVLLPVLRKRYPGMEIQIHEMSTASQIELLRRGQIDAGVMRSPMDTRDLTIRILRRERLGVLLPHEHKLARKKAVALRDLQNCPLILYPSSDPHPSWPDFILSVCRKEGYEPRITQQAGASVTAASFVASGLGFTIVPESLSSLSGRGVAYRPLAGAPHVTEMSLMCRRLAIPEEVKLLLNVVDDLWPLKDIPARQPGAGQHA